MIRECTLQDVEILQHIAQKTFVDTFATDNSSEDIKKYIEEAYAIEKLSSELSEPQSKYYFFEVDKQVAAYLKLNWGNAQTDSLGDDVLEIQRLYVDALYKRKGYGKKMMNFAIEQARILQKQAVWLSVWEKIMLMPLRFTNHLDSNTPARTAFGSVTMNKLIIL